MDGTIYTGSTLFAATNPFLELLAELGIGHTFLTNNPSKSVADYLKHLNNLGVQASAENLYTSAQATIEHLHSLKPSVRRLFVLGTHSMCADFPPPVSRSFPIAPPTNPMPSSSASIPRSLIRGSAAPPGGSNSANLLSPPIPIASARLITHRPRRLRLHLRHARDRHWP